MILSRLIKLVAPAECLVCGREGAVVCIGHRPELIITKRPTCFRCNILSQDGRTCARCRHYTKLAGVTVASHYDGPLKELIRALKYQMAADAAEICAELLSPFIEPKQFDLIVPAPAAAVRRRQRGYNQAELIARALARLLDLPHSPTLGRWGSSRQVGTPRKQRLAQVETAFYVIKPERVRGQRILLIDDVLTTGATLSACAAKLKESGAKRVWGAVVAKH